MEPSVQENQTHAVTVMPSRSMMSWQPDELRQRIAQEKELRQIVIEYYRSEMKPDVHYYTMGDGQKPSITKEGGLNLCSLFNVVPHPDDPVETYFDDGHLAVRQRVRLYNQAGAEMAIGDGYCTTRESKYAYRWSFASDVPAHLDKGTLRKRTVGRTQKYTQYRVPNEELADLYNTVTKMAFKRGLTAASLCLPLVSELFTQDLDETNGNGEPVHVTGSDLEEPPQDAPPPNKPLRTPQAQALQQLWATITRHQIPHERVRAWFGDAGVSSTKTLTLEQLQQYIAYVEENGAEAFPERSEDQTWHEPDETLNDGIDSTPPTTHSSASASSTRSTISSGAQHPVPTAETQQQTTTMSSPSPHSAKSSQLEGSSHQAASSKSSLPAESATVSQETKSSTRSRERRDTSKKSSTSDTESSSTLQSGNPMKSQNSETDYEDMSNLPKSDEKSLSSDSDSDPLFPPGTSVEGVKSTDGHSVSSEGASDFVTPLQRFTGLAEAVILPIDHEERRQALSLAIAKSCFKVDSWLQIPALLSVTPLPDDDALSLDIFEAICHRIQSQGMPQPDQSGGFLGWARSEKQRYLKTRVPKQEATP